VVRAADTGDHLPLQQVPGVPESLARVVEQAMDRRPERRFATADELARALRAAVPAGQARVPGPVAAPRRAQAQRQGSGRGAGNGDGGTGTGMTRTFGPRPPRREEAEARGRRRLPLLAVAGLLAAGLVVLVRGPLASDEGDDTGGGDEACAPAAPSGAEPGGQVVEGDVAGDGCTVQGVYQPETLPDGTTAMVLTIALDGADKQIGMGDAGDRVVLGDWDCDGDDTPGLYRTATGVVDYFDVWPTVEQRSYQPDRSEQLEAGGDARLDEGAGEGDDCDRVSLAG
jgi:hypothetical protein